MSEKPYHVTDEENRKKESRESKLHGGNTSADSEPLLIKVRLFLSPSPSCPYHKCIFLPSSSLPFSLPLSLS
jgi:hypothetical protein